MKVYIDVSNLISVNFVTGIQRVVREVVVRMIKNSDIQTILLSCPKGQEEFDILDNEAFLNFYLLGRGSKEQVISGMSCALNELEAGSVFFDIDSVWSSHQRRSQILPILKKGGVKLAVFIHDIIPITYPQYCHENTAFFFMGYLAAYLQYADLILTSTQSTLDAINLIIKQLNLPPKQGYVTWLGADFAADQKNNEVISKEAKAVVKKGKYILCVGTIEPRKNHKLLLDAFDEKWADMGINLVFAGRIGWNVEEFEKRIQTHPYKDKKFFHLSGQNDASIDYLYRNAFIVAFPTFEEGFGLPMIEAIERGSVLIASDVPVLKEVGGRFCDYFNPNSTQEILAIVDNYCMNPAIYQAKKAALKDFVPVTWDSVTHKMISALKSLECHKKENTPQVKQIVILSAREEMLLSTLPYIEKFMTFIKEVVICCPDKSVPIINEKYSGNLKLSFLTDSEILHGSPLPKDHTTRNMYLRCLAMKNEKIDNTFIMSDDDYRPLYPIDLDTFYKSGKYQAYYCFDLEDWTGTAWNPTSFDAGMKRTFQFLKDNQYPCKHYASHMPQIIDKRIFNEMLEKHRGMERQGYCEWCTYFNYLEYHYPSIIKTLVYKSMCWPGNPTDWKMQVFPSEYLFENYYEENYCKGGIFEEFSAEFHDDIQRENAEKIKRFIDRQNLYQSYQNTFDIYSKIYICEYRELPRIGFIMHGPWHDIVMPKYLIAKEKSFAWIPFEIRIDKSNSQYIQELEISCYYSDISGNTFYHAETIKMPPSNAVFDMPLYGYKLAGNYYYNVEVKIGTKKTHMSVPIAIIK